MTPLVEWSVLSDHLLGTLQQAFDAQSRVWTALREGGQAVGELDHYWRLADELRALEKALGTARQAATPSSLGPLTPIGQQLATLDSLVGRGLATFRTVHVLVLLYVIGAALDDSSGRAGEAVLRRVLNLAPTEFHLLALWETVIRAAGRDIKDFVGSTRSFVAKGVEWQANKLKKADLGLTLGLTARGQSAEERDRVAANVDRNPKVLDSVPDDRDGGEFNSVESLDPDRRHDLRNSLLPGLAQRANPRQGELLEAVLLRGENPSKAWVKPSDWNGLMAKAARIGKAHSGNC